MDLCHAAFLSSLPQSQRSPFPYLISSNSDFPMKRHLRFKQILHYRHYNNAFYVLSSSIRKMPWFASNPFLPLLLGDQSKTVACICVVPMALDMHLCVSRPLTFTTNMCLMTGWLFSIYRENSVWLSLQNNGRWISNYSLFPDHPNDCFFLSTLLYYPHSGCLNFFSYFWVSI